MEYQVTARKWRPRTFGEVIGQEHVTRALKNAIASGKIPHAYLFSGPRGVGKTTTARILAKALNCTHGPTPDPCNECSICNEIMSGNSLDVLEIDGASNRGIDDIRKIRDEVIFAPLSGRYKVYIIDEVHMLTKEASNALLKTLEEPPNHVIFVLATTEAHKVLPTIRSRCQHYVFKKIPSAEIIRQLKHICNNESIKYTEESLFLIARASDGSMRDAQSILDQVVLFSDRNLTEEVTQQVLGIPDESYFYGILVAIKNNDPIRMLETIQGYLDSIGDISLFTRNFIEYFRNGLLVKNLSAEHDLITLTSVQYQRMQEGFEFLSQDETMRIMNLLIELYHQLRGDTHERFLLESYLFKILDYRNMIPLSQIRDEILAIKGESQKNLQPTHREPQREIAQRELPRQDIAEKSKDEPNVYQHHKINREPGKPVLDRDDNQKMSSREAFIKVITRLGPLMRHMINHVGKVEEKGNSVVIKIKDHTSFNYIQDRKTEIEEGFSQLMGADANIDFICSEVDENQPDNNPQQSQKEPPKNVDKSQELAEKVNEIKEDSHRKEQKSEDEHADIISDLFNGNIE